MFLLLIVFRQYFPKIRILIVGDEKDIKLFQLFQLKKNDIQKAKENS